VGLAMIAAEGRGCLLYLRQEGRGIGLINKIRAYHLQDSGLDTVEANLALGLPADGRDYAAAAAVLHELGIERLRLISNNPAKLAGLQAQGIEIVERVPLQPTLNPTNAPYLRTKVLKMGHLLDV
jgi:GTP cyclohydrolase II